MKTIIAGSREGVTLLDVKEAVGNCGWTISSVVSGRCRGVDKLGEVIAHEMQIPVHPFPANWRPLGPRGPIDYSAGPKRNAVMAQNAEALIAVWDGISSGTKNMIDEARARNLRVHIHYVQE